VHVAGTGAQALEVAAKHPPDLVILDLGLPDLDGVEVIQGLRGWTDAPIIVLSGRADSTDKVEALDAGADDYITKPFSVKELMARLRAAIRRSHLPEESQDAVIAIGDIELHPTRRLVLKSGQPVHLTPKQFDLLRFLMCHSGRPVPHERLLRFVWGNEYQGELEYLRTFMSQIRKKIEDDPANPKYLLTDAYVGYRFCEAH
jgi:two-component system KDP operon response regulator KdpE